MAEDAASTSKDVVLGLDAAWGFAPADQTSPALAGAAGSLIDTAMTEERVTELRIHGVSGSDGPTMLEHPQAVQVAGDTMAGFYRRWSPDGRGRPSVPWKLEAYSWGGLTEAPLASASWLLLAPFMMYNLAYFMLPPEAADAGPVAKPGQFPHLRRDRGHGVAQVVLRLLALAATVQFVSSAASVLLSTVAWQAAGNVGLLLPNWMGWYAGWTAGWRVALALAAVAVVVALLWWISVKTASMYEARVSTARSTTNSVCPLTQPGFWRGKKLADRQRRLHAAAACASLALIAALPAGHPAAARWVAVVLSAAVLAAAAISVASPMVDRHEITLVYGGQPPGGRADGWCWGLLTAALAALATSALVSGFTDRLPGRQLGVLPGLTGFLAVLLAVQAALLIVFAVTVAALTRPARAGSQGSAADVRPYLAGNLATLVALLGLVLGGILAAVINIGAARLLGAPVPSGFQFGMPASDALAVPWPVYAFAAAPIGVLLGAMAAAIPLWLRYRDHANQFGQRDGRPRSEVSDAYEGLTAGPGSPNGDDQGYDRHRGAIANAWAIGLIIDDAGLAAALAIGSGLVLALAAEIFAVVDAGPASDLTLLVGWLRGLASLIALVGILVVGGLVGLLRQAYSDAAKRKSIGALWDVGTFWPRAVQPLAPPCYAERAVPEVVDRIRLLTGHITTDADDVAYLKALAGQPDLTRTHGLTVPPGPLLLTGYSQGSVIAPAVIAQLPEDTLPDLALLTLACPARRLYGRAFPAYFGPPQLTELARLLDATAPGQAPTLAGRWKNLRRRSDFIGSWIFAEPGHSLSGAEAHGHIDQPCWDPVTLVADANPTPPPTHRHSQWWQDPRTREIESHLVRLLSGRLDGYEVRNVPSPPAEGETGQTESGQGRGQRGRGRRRGGPDSGDEPATMPALMDELLGSNPGRRLSSVGPASARVAEVMASRETGHSFLPGVFWWLFTYSDAYKDVANRLGASRRARPIVIYHARGTRFDLLLLDPRRRRRRAAMQLNGNDVAASFVSSALPQERLSSLLEGVGLSDSLGFDILFGSVQELVASAEFGVAIVNAPREIPTRTPSRALTLRSANNDPVATLGSFLTDMDETVIDTCLATTAKHALGRRSRALTVEGASLEVVRGHHQSDSCLVRVSKSVLEGRNWTGHKGVLRRPPGEYGRAFFNGAASGYTRTVITGFDKAIFDGSRARCAGCTPRRIRQRAILVPH